MGPEGGERGGRIIAHGTPEQIATVAASHTGNFLARHYAPNQLLTTNNGHSHAGPQPLNIAAASDRVKSARSKFVAPEKKTGMPTARPTEPPKKPAKAPATAKKAVSAKRTKTA
jgi:excinuclease ABC subunit A